MAWSECLAEEIGELFEQPCQFDTPEWWAAAAAFIENRRRLDRDSYAANRKKILSRKRETRRKAGGRAEAAREYYVKNREAILARLRHRRSTARTAGAT